MIKIFFHFNFLNKSIFSSDNPQLGEVARLDTCVTVVDSAEFYSNLGSMKTYEQGDTVGTIAELMMEQVEFSNVVVLNKVHLFCFI